MSWRSLEVWATVSFGVAAGTAIALLLFKNLAPEGWRLQQLSREAIAFLVELGDISGGLIVVIFIIILGGNRIMTVLLRGIEKLQEMRDERKRIREEALAEGMTKGMAKKNKEWESWVEELIEQGVLPPDVRPPSSTTEDEQQQP